MEVLDTTIFYTDHRFIKINFGMTKSLKDKCGEQYVLTKKETSILPWN